MSRAEFSVRLEADGTGSIRLNGQEVPGVIGIRIDGARDVTPRVTLQLLSDVDVEGVGSVEAAAPAAEAASEELLDILSAIDPETLDREALEGMGLGEDVSPAQRYLDIIKGYIRGD